MAYNYTVKKGDSLNKIVQQYGFKNYKEAGISSVPSGNFDLIREGEQINIGNYNPNQVSGINTGSSVLSSEDNASKFKENSDRLDKMNTMPEDTGTEEKNTKKNKDKIDYDTDKGQITTGDAVLDKINAYSAEQKKKQQDDIDKKKKEYEKLFKTQMSLIDATANATTKRIYDTYDKRLEEQARINDLNIARVKAYGLGGGGRFTPVSFGDAITNREREASDRVMSLERERDNLIAQAENARREGESALLESKMENIFDLEKTLRENLQQIEKDAQEQYKLLRELRQEEEDKHKKEVEKMKQKLAVLATDDNFDEMTAEEKDAYITSLMSESGLDYFEVLSAIRSSSIEAEKSSLDIQKKKADIMATNALTNQRNRSNQNGETDDLSTSQKQQLEQAGLLKADRQTQLDYLHGDDIQREEALLKANGGGEGSAESLVQQGKMTQQQLDDARKEGYTDEEILDYFN